MTRAIDDRLGALVSDAVSRLDATSGGAAVCTFSKAGVAVPGIKYAEGRWAALREAQRLVRRSSGGADADVAAIVGGVLTDWRTALDRAVDGSGPDWVAYRTGGVDALTDLTS